MAQHKLHGVQQGESQNPTLVEKQPNAPIYGESHSAGKQLDRKLPARVLICLTSKMESPSCPQDLASLVSTKFTELL